MAYRKLARVPKGKDTKFGGPCRLVYVNWDTFSKEQTDKEQTDKENHGEYHQQEQAPQ